MTTQVDKYIKTYLTLRERKAALEKRHAEEIALITAPMETIENILQKTMDELGTKALPTHEGTAYLSTLTSVKIEDWDAYMDFVRENEAWEFLERRANKTSVEQYAAAHDKETPPGVNLTSRIRVNVKSAS
jgi:hypothetical protein